MIDPTVRRAIRIDCITVDFAACVANQATISMKVARAETCPQRQADWPPGSDTLPTGHRLARRHGGQV